MYRSTAMRFFVFAFFLSLSSFYFSVSAQLNIVAESSGFEEPRGFVQIFPLNNGNIVLLSAVKDGAVLYRLFDEKHKVIKEKELEPSFMPLDGSYAGVFMINNEIVMIANQFRKRTPKCYRLILDAASGDIKDEKLLMEKDRLSGWVRHVPETYHSVQISPDKQYYAAYATSGTGSGLEKVVSVFNNKHEEISQATILIPHEPYKVKRMVAEHLDNTGIFHLTSAGSFASDKKDNRTFFIEALLKPGHHGQLECKEINAPEFKVSDGRVIWNPYLEKFVAVVQDFDQKLKLYNLDPAGGAPQQIADLSLSEKTIAQVHEYTQHKKKSFQPLHILFRPDGYTVVHAKIDNYVATGTRASFSMSNLHELIIQDYSTNGTLRQTNAVPQYFNFPSRHLRAFEMLRSEGAPGKTGSDEYKFFGFIPGPVKSSVIINDVPDNEERFRAGKDLNTSRFIGGCEAYVYPLSPDSLVSARKQVIPQTGKETHLLLTSSITPVPDKKQVIAIAVDKAPREKDLARLIRFQYE